MAAAIDESNGLSFLAHAPLCVVVLDAEVSLYEEPQDEFIKNHGITPSFIYGK
jgi:hypothetical protein